jgi:hypothetical protein
MTVASRLGTGVSCVVVAALLAILAACGPQTLDTSSYDALVRSLGTLREPMEIGERDRFDEALRYMIGGATLPAVDTTPEFAGILLDLCRPLSGLTSDGIITEARRRRLVEVQRPVRELEERCVQAEADRQDLAAFHLSAARVYLVNRLSLEWPVIEFNAENTTRHRIWLIHFRAALLKPGEEEPWLVEEFDQLVLHGLAPGARDLWRVEPKQQQWEYLIAPQKDLIFTLDVLSLESRGGNVIASTDWSGVEAHRLELYKTTLNKIRSSGTLALDSPPRLRAFE